jgi:8-oxo-dGTP pyrophosphatase MutT (NUDIX family)
MLLRFDDHEPRVLLMTRAHREDDLWSGQVSLPGGHVESADGSLLAAAVRETQEELGFDLRTVARPLGELAPMRAGARGKLLPLWVYPVVFERRVEPIIVPGLEASDAFWFPLSLAASGEIGGHYHWKQGEESLHFPCWRHDGRVVWGLTYRLLESLLRLWIECR